MRKPALQGIVVVECAEYVAGPFAAKLLANFGADVVKIERPGAGDPIRRLGPFAGGTPDPDHGGLYQYLNADKSGVTLASHRRPARSYCTASFGSPTCSSSTTRPAIGRPRGSTSRRYTSSILV